MGVYGAARDRPVRGSGHAGVVMASTSVVMLSLGSMFSYDSTSLAVYSTSMSTEGYGVAMCRTVKLSTATGAQCDCHKFSMDAETLQIKSLPMGEVRQIVASGYKLAHGQPLGSITWK